MTVRRAEVADDGLLRPLEVQPDGGAADAVRGVASRAAIAPARLVAFEVLRRVLDDGAYA